MPTEQPFLLMCDFHGHIGWYLQAHTLSGWPGHIGVRRLYLLRTRDPKSLPCVRMWPPCVQGRLLFLHPYTPRFKGRWTRIIYWMNTWLSQVQVLWCLICCVLFICTCFMTAQMAKHVFRKTHTHADERHIHDLKIYLLLHFAGQFTPLMSSCLIFHWEKQKLSKVYFHM